MCILLRGPVLLAVCFAGREFCCHKTGSCTMCGKREKNVEIDMETQSMVWDLQPLTQIDVLYTFEDPGPKYYHKDHSDCGS